MSMPPSTGDRLHNGDVIRISELTVTSLEIVGETFQNCQIIGPAILIPLRGNSFNHCGFDGPDANSIFWRIPPDRTFVIGAIGLIDCTFSSCTFSKIGLAGGDELFEQLNESFSSSNL